VTKPSAPSRPRREQRHCGQSITASARAARQLERVAGQAEAGDVGDRVHAGRLGERAPGVLSRVVVAISCA
jgi:hypothetical protein